MKIFAEWKDEAVYRLEGPEDDRIKHNEFFNRTYKCLRSES